MRRIDESGWICGRLFAYRAVMLYGTAPGKLGFPVLVALSVAVFFVFMSVRSFDKKSRE